MELEEAIKRCKELIKTEHANWIGISNQVAIEIVLQALDGYQIKELLPLKNKLDNISATELQTILQPYYIQKESLEHKNKIINNLKNKLDNSIPKEKAKIRAYTVQHLKEQIRGRKDCTIFIPYSCSKQIERLEFSDYLELEKDLKARNIKIKVEE